MANSKRMPLDKKLFLAAALPFWLSALLFVGLVFISLEGPRKIDAAVDDMRAAATSGAAGAADAGAGLAALLRLQADAKRFSMTATRVAVVVVVFGTVVGCLALYFTVNSLTKRLRGAIAGMNECAGALSEMACRGSPVAPEEVWDASVALTELTRDVAILAGGVDFEGDGSSGAIRAGDVVPLGD